MDDVCHDAQMERKLQPPDGEIFLSNSTTTDDDSQLDVREKVSRLNRTFFDAKIFHPHAKICPKTTKDT